MRLVQVLIPEGKRPRVLETLDEEGIDYAVFDEVGRGDFEAMVQFPVPPSGVEPVMAHLTDAGVQEGSYTIVLPTETVVSQRLPALKERFPGLRISREELVARAEDPRRPTRRSSRSCSCAPSSQPPGCCSTPRRRSSGRWWSHH